MSEGYKTVVIKSYSSGDVAKICDVTPRTIIRWISSGKLPAFKLPGRGNNRVSEDALLSFLHNNEMPIPRELEQAEDRHCVILASDKYLVRHVKRIVRDADYITHVISDMVEAGLSIAANKPQLVIIDAEIIPGSPWQTASKIKAAMPIQGEILLFVEKTNDLDKFTGKTDMTFLNKPIDLSVFAGFIEQLQE